MKKFSLSLLVLASVGLLAGCSGSGDDYVIKEGKSVLTEDIINANCSENIYYAFGRAYTFQDSSLPDDCEPIRTHDHYYWAVVRKNGKYGVYSFLADKMLIEPRLPSDPSDLNDDFEHYDSDNPTGFQFKYQDVDENYYVVDGSGNILLKSEDPFTHNINYERDYETKTFTARLNYYFISASENLRKDFVYDKNNKAVEVSIEPGDVYSKSTKTEFKNGYVLTDGKIYRSYSQDGSLKAYFEVPSDINNSFLFAGKVIYQRVTNLGQATKVNTYVFDLFKDDAKIQNVDFKGEIFTLSVLKNTGDNNYAAVSITEVNSKGNLGSNRVLIIDDSFRVYDDITRKNYFGSMKLSTGYYLATVRDPYTNDGASYNLYNPSFELVFSTMGYSHADFNPITEVLSVSDEDDEVYGFYDGEGKAIVPYGKYKSVQRLDTNIYEVLENGYNGGYSAGKYYYNASTQKEVAYDSYSEDTKIVLKNVVEDKFLAQVEYLTTAPDDYTYSLMSLGGALIKKVEHYLASYYEIYTVPNAESYFGKGEICPGYYRYKENSITVEKYFVLANVDLIPATAIPAPSAA